VVVDPAPEGKEGEVRLTIVKPKKAKTPVAVGAGGVESDTEAGSDDDETGPGAVLDDAVEDAGADHGE
jgi:hypothetical protein